MRCRKCSERWSLECGLGPGGAMAPGGYLGLAIGIALVGSAIGFFVSWLIMVIAAVLSGLLMLMSITNSGNREPITAYQGSECPKCGQRNRIWPWNF